MQRCKIMKYIYEKSYTFNMNNTLISLPDITILFKSSFNYYSLSSSIIQKIVPQNLLQSDIDIDMGKTLISSVFGSVKVSIFT